MRYVADLHMHSRFARATSKDLTLPVLDEWARKKGVQVLGTGDFTHPFWFGELSQQLIESPEDGLYIRKDSDPKTATRFILSCEISSIYSQAGKTRRVHTLVLFPTLKSVAEFNEQLAKTTNLRSDGRPITGQSAKAIAELAFKVDPAAIVIPAHAWTPWFSVFGSMSGFDDMEDCFEDLTPKILAIETGLSSDPPMNWRLSALDQVALMSSSDSHSAHKIAREATVFEGELSYAAVRSGFATGAPAKSQARTQSPAQLVATIEFFPEEGKYHYDGHRNCKLSLSPAERLKQGDRCPVCGRPLTIGVLSRVEALADRPEGFKPAGAPDYHRLVPLEEIIAEAYKIGRASKTVRQQFDRLIAGLASELTILLEADLGAIADLSSAMVAEGVKRVRQGKLQIKPGYDGEYGVIKLFDESERADLATAKNPQVSLF